MSRQILVNHLLITPVTIWTPTVMTENGEREGILRMKQEYTCIHVERVGMHCSLYPPPPHTIHSPLTDFVLKESVNCITEVPDTRNSAN